MGLLELQAVAQPPDLLSLCCPIRCRAVLRPLSSLQVPAILEAKWPVSSMPMMSVLPGLGWVVLLLCLGQGTVGVLSLGQSPVVPCFERIRLELLNQDLPRQIENLPAQFCASL